MSKIEWTEKTWNPTVGCSEVSPGCTNCYALTMANRLQNIDHSKKDYAGTAKHLENERLVWTGKVNLLHHRLKEPILNKKPTVYFVDSMSDLFHKDVPFAFIDLVYATMAICHWHKFQVLTKRPERMLEWYEFKDTDWENEGMQGNERIRYQTYHTHGMSIPFHKWHWPLKNVHVGVSVENQKYASRIAFLMKVPAAVRFLSCEPLLGPLDITNKALNNAYSLPTGYQEMNGRRQGIEWTDPGDQFIGVDWVICGGESGHNARPMHPDWARSLRDQCKAADVPFFFKQWGQWKPIDMPADQNNIARLKDNERWLNTNSGHGFHGENVWRMRKTGKHEAGRLLDGQEYNELPNTKIYKNENSKQNQNVTTEK